MDLMPTGAGFDQHIFVMARFIKLEPGRLAPGRGSRRMTYLLAKQYAEGSELNLSDQITIPGSLWEALTSGGGSLIFVQVGEESGVVGRIIPGTLGTVGAGECQLPEWMWRRLGLDPADEETYIGLTVTPLSVAGTITLRAREESSLVDLGDSALETLSAALSGAYGPSWACLSVGSELPLAIGVFDVMGLRSAEGEPLTIASILNTDVNLDIMPALDHVDTPTPYTPPKAEPPEVVAEPVQQSSLQPLQQSSLQPLQQMLRPRAGSIVGFVPFSGRGYRLGDP